MMSNEEKQMSDLSRHDISMTDSPVEADSLHSEGFIANLFDGRMNRWKFFLYGILIGAFLYLAYYVLTIDFWIGGFLYGVCNVFIISIIVKRLHDINKSAEWCIPILIVYFIRVVVSESNLVVIIGFIVDGFILFYPGTKGCNRYGKA